MSVHRRADSTLKNGLVSHVQEYVMLGHAADRTEAKIPHAQQGKDAWKCFRNNSRRALQN